MPEYIKVPNNVYKTSWEEVPDEDLWQDSELDKDEMMANIERNLYIGRYKLIRRKHDNL